MIVGIGVDVVRVSRVSRLAGRYGARFWERILTPAERELCARRREPAAFAAGRFAAKEALAKALGSGLRSPATLRRMSLLSDAAGRPYFELADDLGRHLAARGVGAVHVSLSGEGDWAVATVVLDGR